MITLRPKAIRLEPVKTDNEKKTETTKMNTSRQLLYGKDIALREKWRISIRVIVLEIIKDNAAP